VHHAAKHRSTYVRRPATSEAHGYKDTLAGCQIGLLENIIVLKYLQVPCHIETTNTIMLNVESAEINELAFVKSVIM